MLKLCCSNQVIAVCTFNLASYIGKQALGEKALIKPESYQESSDNERVLKGNAAQYPEAYIEFRLKVETPEAAKAAAAANKKPSNPAKKTMTSQITKSRAQNILLATQ